MHVFRKSSQPLQPAGSPADEKVLFHFPGPMHVTRPDAYMAPKSYKDRIKLHLPSACPMKGVLYRVTDRLSLTGHPHLAQS